MAKIKSITIIIILFYSNMIYSQIFLDSAVVKSSKIRDGIVIFKPDITKRLISITGENDPLKFIFHQPGVASGIEGSGSMFVRGGNTGNNRIELDGIPFYDNGHLLGLISSFSGSIIDNISFQKGGLAASNGDFTSSLTKVTTKIYPNGHSISFSPFYIGISSSDYISKCKKVSYLTSARYSPAKALLSLAKQTGVLNQTEIKPKSFDIFYKLNIISNQKNHFHTGLYYSKDNISFNDQEVNMEIVWTNFTTYTSWNYKPIDWLVIESKAYYQRYTSNQNQSNYKADCFKNLLSLNININEAYLGVNGRIFYNNIILSSGIDNKIRDFDFATCNLMKKQSDNFISLYTNLEYNHKYFSLQGGLRHAFIFKGHNDYHIKLSGIVTDYITLEFTYDKMNQFTHLAENGLAGWRDFIIPANDSLPPEISTQYYIGTYYKKLLNDGILKVSIGSYYKKMSNLTSFIRAYDLFFTPSEDFHNILRKGKGTSKGIESSINFSSEKTTSTLSYTYSITDRLYNGINNGLPYRFQYDRRHILKLIGSYNLINRINLKNSANINISYTSGECSTLPIARYYSSELPFVNQLINDESLTELTEKNLQSLLILPSINGYSFPSYFRIDLGYNFTWIKGKRQIELTTGIVNILNTRNASFIFYSKGYWKRLNLIPITPTIGLKISF